MSRGAIFKRFWPALVALTLLLPVLAACGTGTSTSTGTVTLTYGWWSNGPTKDSAMQSWIQDFESTHPNIKIQAEIIPWSNYWDKLKATTAGGNAYDLIGVCSCMGAPYFSKHAFYDLSQFSDYASASQQLQQGPVSLFNWDGKQYGLPVGVAVNSMGYNKTLLQQAGVQMPDPTQPLTFDQFKALAAQLTKTDSSGKVTQVAVQPTDLLDEYFFVEAEGGHFFDRQINPTKVTVNTPEGIQGLTDYKQMFDTHVFPSVDQLTDGPFGGGDYASLQTNKVGFARVGPWNFQDIQATTPNIAIAPFFTIKKPVMLAGANGLSIYRGTKHAKEAWEFLKFATAQAGQTSFAKFSDVPANKQVLGQLSTIETPTSFVPTVQYNASIFVPLVETPNDQLLTMIDETTKDMIRGKLTPEQAAQTIQQKGNALLASQ